MTKPYFFLLKILHRAVFVIGFPERQSQSQPSSQSHPQKPDPSRHPDIISAAGHQPHVAGGHHHKKRRKKNNTQSCACCSLTGDWCRVPGAWCAVLTCSKEGHLCQRMWQPQAARSSARYPSQRDPDPDPESETESGARSRSQRPAAATTATYCCQETGSLCLPAALLSLSFWVWVWKSRGNPGNCHRLPVTLTFCEMARSADAAARGDFPFSSSTQAIPAPCQGHVSTSLGIAPAARCHCDFKVGTS